MIGHRSGRALDRTALDAVLRVAHRLLVGAIAHGDALHADLEAGGVHHDEHVFEAAVLLADEVTDGARADFALAVAEQQHAGRARLDAELVLDRRAVDIVALSERAVRPEHDLRHDEERDALDSLGRVRRARQHEVHDVFGEVVIAVGDEDLLAEEAIRAVGLRHGACAHLRQVRTRLRLGQVHRAGPATFDQPRQVGVLLLVRAGHQQRLDRAVGEQRTERK